MRRDAAVVEVADGDAQPPASGMQDADLGVMPEVMDRADQAGEAQRAVVVAELELRTRRLPSRRHSLLMHGLRRRAFVIATSFLDMGSVGYSTG